MKTTMTGLGIADVKTFRFCSEKTKRDASSTKAAILITLVKLVV